MKVAAAAALAALGACSDPGVIGRVAGHRDPSAPLDVAGAFAGPPNAEPDARPTLIYPLDGALLGRNLGGMNIQWRAGLGNTLFRVRLRGRELETPLYAGAAACPAGKCQLRVPDAFWRRLGTIDAGAAVTLMVDAVSAAGAPVASSAKIGVTFTRDRVAGELYYFQVRGGSTIMRAIAPDEPATPFLGPSSGSTRNHCVGCHEVSPDGCRVAVATWDGGTRTGTMDLRFLAVVDGRDGERLLSRERPRSSFQAFSPDGERLLTLFGGQLALRNAVGSLLAAVALALVGPPGQDVAVHPQWSPDGSSVVFTRHVAGAPTVDDAYHAGDIMRMPFVAGTFQQAQVLIARSDAEFHYYPTVSPDSRWVAFATGRIPGRSHHAPAGSFIPYAQVTGRLRMVPLNGGPPIELARATHGVDVSASWPRFAPVRDGSRFLLLFSSTIDYGWQVEQPAREDQRRWQLWAAGIDLGRSGDPSFAPFWLPAQAPEQRNHLGIWVLPRRDRCP